MVEIDRVCGSPNCSKTGKHLCSGCGEEIYCSKECQKAHWPDHKTACKSAVKPEAAAFLKSFDDLSIKQLKNILMAKAASFEKKKKDKVLASLESVHEKKDLVKLVSDHVKIAEIESLLTSTTASASPSTSSSSSVKPNKTATRTQSMPTPTPAQLKQQAKLMRENPGMVRKAQPAFANMSDAQIREYADQLDMAASNPDMMKEVERMSKLSEKERNDLQAIQEGLSGMKPMDLTWMDNTIQVLKTNAQLFKTMMKGKGAALGGVTDDQVESFIDMASRMDASTLKIILRLLVYLGSLYRPALDLYAKVDSWTFGCARFIVMAIVLFVAYWISVPIFYLVKFILVQLYALVMFLWSLASGAGKAVPSSVPLSGAGSTAFKNSVKTAVDSVAAGLGAAGIAKVASSAATGGAAGAAANDAASEDAKGAQAMDEDANYDF